MKKKNWFILAPIIAGILVFLDQLTKYFARTSLADGDHIVIEDVFRLRLSFNKGAAWGIFQGRVSILSIISIVMAIALIIFFVKIPEGKRYTFMRILTISVWAGAVGNLIDRIGFGRVTDFLYFELIDFPIFNVADCYITIAMFIFVLLMLFYYKEEELGFISWGKGRKGDQQE